LIPSHHWARTFTVTDNDLEYLSGLLLERETPLTSVELARALIERRLNKEADVVRERYRDARVYNPTLSYQVGQKIVFPAFDFAVGEVSDVRPGENEQYGDFSVIGVLFEDDAEREFAANLSVAHKLNDSAEDITASFADSDLTPDDILNDMYDELVGAVDERLSESSELVVVSSHWFPRDLILEVNEGHLNLAEAVLDLAEGGPMTAEQIAAEIGGLGSAPPELQIFSLNYALNEDPRFDEVGPAGQVWWYLTRLLPPEVREAPPMLRYSEIPYERELLTTDMLALEAEIDDELSPLKDTGRTGESINITLIYPHRRVGTLPLNAKMRRIFPTAHRTQHIWVTLVDGQDGEEYQGWVVRNERYVFGLAPFYRKHKLPVGAYVVVRPAESPEKIVVDFHAHRPRTEWIRLINPKNNQIAFENHKRAIGAEYDDLMILGADDLAAADALFQPSQQSRRALAQVLRSLISELSRLNPQGTVHAKTLYSAINVIRRCPPGPLFATLLSEPEFEHVGNHYWKLASNN
jgi:hypothetical protein